MKERDRRKVGGKHPRLPYHLKRVWQSCWGVLEPMSPIEMSESLRDLLTLVSLLHSDNGGEVVPLDN